MASSDAGWSPYNYTRCNPLNKYDPDGKFWDTILDVAFIVVDVVDIVSTATDGQEITGTQWAALGADVVGALIPFATGGGAAVRAASKADDIVDGVKALDHMSDAAKSADVGADATKLIGPAGDTGGTVTKQVPSDWSMKTSKNGEGTLFKDPKNPQGNNVRVQGGNPNSPNPGQQKPYVKQTKNGKVVDVNGKEVSPKSKEAHIPKEEFKFRKDN